MGWDGHCDTDSTGCTAYLVFEMALGRAIFDDDLGDQARDYAGSDVTQDLAAAMVGSDEGRASAWWGDVKTGSGADATAVTSAALDTAGAWLRRDLGDPSVWTWGRIHTVAFREATLGGAGIAPLEAYFNTGAKPAPGAAGAVNNNYRLSRGYDDPYDPEFEPADTLEELFSVTNGPSMRALYDMTDADAGRIITTTGQSGHPFSRHADDWVGAWLANETVPLPFSQAAIADASATLLTLVPGS